jgi:hypothetical protein
MDYAAPVAGRKSMSKGLFWKEVVQPGSTFRAKVTPTQDPDVWNADLFLRGHDGHLVAHFDNAALRAGIPPLPLAGKSPAHYWGQLVLTFAGPSSTRVELSVVKPDGTTPHGKPYDEIHANAPADAVAIAVFMV